MIHIAYNPDRGRLRLSGHAGSAPLGEDLVCAAVSALCATLAENLRVYDPKARVVMESGYARISSRDPDLRPLFDIIYRGLRQLARQYPDYIHTRREFL